MIVSKKNSKTSRGAHCESMSYGALLWTRQPVSGFGRSVAVDDNGLVLVRRWIL